MYYRRGRANNGGAEQPDIHGGIIAFETDHLPRNSFLNPGRQTPPFLKGQSVL